LFFLVLIKFTKTKSEVVIIVLKRLRIREAKCFKLKYFFQEIAALYVFNGDSKPLIIFLSISVCKLIERKEKLVLKTAVAQLIFPIRRVCK